MREPEAKRRLLSALGRDITDKRVLEAMAEVPREVFVLPEDMDRAYENVPLPIGEGQTISQPLIVALMLQALDLQPSERVLEVGTGSGYQAALLARLAAEVVTVERIPALVERAKQVLHECGCENVSVHPAEEVLGWKKSAPYDAIIVAAAAPSAPPELVGQLTAAGRMVVPVGTPFQQNLVLVRRQVGGLEVKALGDCRFVPLIGAGAWEDDWRSDEEGPLAPA